MGKPKNKRRWCEADLQDALNAHINGDSLRNAASRFGVTESNIRRRKKLLQAGKTITGSGRKNALSAAVEQDLTECINILCQTGFSPTRAEIRCFVRDYVTNHKLETPFKDNLPGKDWVKGVMLRNRLSLKKANFISTARVSATANPFIIYDLYDTLEKEIKDKNLKPEQVWNLDESGFPTDPSKSRVVGPIGKTSYKLTWGAGRENITTLAACSAAGRVLDPMVVFPGASLWSTWKGKNALPNTLYAYSKNGWMTTDVFYTWFLKFSEIVKERPLLIVYDGHLSHVSIELIEKAREEQITIIKLPPHVTDRLQPLDVTCFGPLKREWEKSLMERMNIVGPSETMTKSAFVDQLCKIWHKGLSPENVIAGFRTTGVFPVDRTKYKMERFDARILKSYQRWCDMGKPENMMEELAFPGNSTEQEPAIQSTSSQPVHPSTPTNHQPVHPSTPTDHPVSSSATNNQPANFSPSTQGPASSSTSVANSTEEPQPPITPNVENTATTQSVTPSSDHSNCDCNNCQILGQPPVAPPGFKWIPKWTLEAESKKTFAEMILDKMKGPKKKTTEKRKKIDKTAKVITDKKYEETIREMEEKEKTKKSKEKNATNQKRTAKAKKGIDFRKMVNEQEEAKKNQIEETADDLKEPEEHQQDQEEEEDIGNHQIEQPAINYDERSVSSDDNMELDGEAYEKEELVLLWKYASLPTPESDIKGKWFGVIFHDEKEKPHFFVGRLISRILWDEDGPVKSFLVESLKPKHGTNDNIFESYADHNRDVFEYPIADVIAGPLSLKPLKGRKWELSAYPRLLAKFECVKSLDRQELFKTLV